MGEVIVTPAIVEGDGNARPSSWAPGLVLVQSHDFVLFAQEPQQSAKRSKADNDVRQAIRFLLRCSVENAMEHQHVEAASTTHLTSREPYRARVAQKERPQRACRTAKLL